jgi:uncharacterized membrane protein YozB (DUF420 family)
MHAERLNRVCSRVVLVLSLIALVTVLIGFTQPRQPAATDEGALAHIFQISVVLAAATGLLFLFSADWKRPLRSVRPLMIPVGVLVAAFTVLYYLEHVYFR